MRLDPCQIQVVVDARREGAGENLAVRVVLADALAFAKSRRQGSTPTGG